MCENESSGDCENLLPLGRMAARVGVSSRWLKERAESGDVPGLKAGNRWLFRADVVVPIVLAMAKGFSIETGKQFADRNQEGQK